MKHHCKHCQLRFNAALVLIAAILALSPAVWAMSVRELGSPRGFINDYTNTLSQSDLARLNSISTDLEATNGVEMVIVIIDSTDGQSIESYAQNLFETWGIGKEGANNGLLILISMNDQDYRVQTGYGIEGTVTDSLASRIMENEAMPDFKNGAYGQGLIHAAQSFADVLKGEKYEGAGGNTAFIVLLFMTVPIVLMALVGSLIWLAVRLKCPRCGSRVRQVKTQEVLASSYSHSGIRKTDYECTVCHHQFSRMVTIPMLVASTSGGSSGWSSGRSWGSSSSGWSGGSHSSGSFGGFGGGSSGGGGASGHW